MRIWVDDIRHPPDEDWIWFKTSRSVCEWLTGMVMSNSNFKIDLMSLDHDLGGDDTTRPIVLWFCNNDFWPVKTVVHSANPVGIEWLEGMIKRYSPQHRMCPGDTDFCPHNGCTTCQGSFFYYPDPDKGKGRIPAGDTEAWKQYLRRYR